MSSHHNLLLLETRSSIFTFRILSLCAHFSSAVLRERSLLWFGLCAAPYGLALPSLHPHSAVGREPRTHRYRSGTSDAQREQCSFPIGSNPFISSTG